MAILLYSFHEKITPLEMDLIFSSVEKVTRRANTTNKTDSKQHYTSLIRVSWILSPVFIGRESFFSLDHSNQCLPSSYQVILQLYFEPGGGYFMPLALSTVVRSGGHSRK